ncbi:MAG: flagellar motor switch protein FliN [Deltaproteobacteria bacterium]|nr:flagellar motor switch protein FliN [Deltaproteobacteria bacterium]
MTEVDEKKGNLLTNNPDESTNAFDPNKDINDSQISDENPKDFNYEFTDLADAKPSNQASNLDFLLDIPLEITIELGRTKMLINELLKLGQGSVVELSKFAGETLDVFANQRLIAKGEVVVVKDKYGIRLTEIISPMERIVRLK